jgi:hypothetical protein
VVLAPPVPKAPPPPPLPPLALPSGLLATLLPHAQRPRQATNVTTALGGDSSLLVDIVLLLVLPAFDGCQAMDRQSGGQTREILRRARGWPV